jgi:hypothetical protein
VVAQQALSLLLHTLANAVERGSLNDIMPSELRIVWETDNLDGRFVAALMICKDSKEQNETGGKI